MDHCANSSDSAKCNAPALPHHIYCDSCRVATGGYNYNPPALHVVEAKKRVGILNTEVTS